jgi:CRISPR-associated endoribonuclease Cas6
MEVINMRFSLIFELKNNELPLDKNPCIISFFKKALTDYNNGEYFSKYFDGNHKKNYAFSVLMPKAEIKKDIIIIPGKTITLHFSTNDASTAIIFYNAFVKQKNKEFILPLSNVMLLKKINKENEKYITSDKILIQMLSPLCVRIHDKENNKDLYLETNNAEFETEIKRIVKVQVLDEPLITDAMVNEFRCSPIQAKKTVVLHHGIYVTCNFGIFQLVGHPLLLSYLYMNGFGSRSNGGFGLFEIARQGGEIIG